MMIFNGRPVHVHKQFLRVQVSIPHAHVCGTCRLIKLRAGDPRSMPPLYATAGEPREQSTV